MVTGLQGISSVPLLEVLVVLEGGSYLLVSGALGGGLEAGIWCMGSDELPKVGGLGIEARKALRAGLLGSTDHSDHIVEHTLRIAVHERTA